MTVCCFDDQIHFRPCFQAECFARRSVRCNYQTVGEGNVERLQLVRAHGGVCAPRVAHIYDEHSTVFAYGQTGSGKTHSMMGSHDEGQFGDAQHRGIIPRVVLDLFKSMRESDEAVEYTVKVVSCGWCTHVALTHSQVC